jgi:transcriptional regulator with GAF, ATPase, and Fis domain
MSSSLSWEMNGDSAPQEPAAKPSEWPLNSLSNVREAALALLREVESLANREPNSNGQLTLQEEVQRYETELIRNALQRTRGNQRRAAKLLGVKVTTLNCKIKRLGISLGDYESSLGVLA